MSQYLQWNDYLGLGVKVDLALVDNETRINILKKWIISAAPAVASFLVSCKLPMKVLKEIIHCSHTSRVTYNYRIPAMQKEAIWPIRPALRAIPVTSMCLL